MKEWGRVKGEMLRVRDVGGVFRARVVSATVVVVGWWLVLCAPGHAWPGVPINGPARRAGAVGRAGSAAEACIRAGVCA